MELSELCKLLHVKDTKTALKWCKKHKIPTILISNKLMTYTFFVNAVVDRKVISTLKEQDPTHWRELYKYYMTNDRYGYVVATECVKEEEPIKMTSYRRPKSDLAKNFAKGL